MSRERLAAAYDALAEASAQVAHELRGNDQPGRDVPSAPAPTQAAGAPPPSAPAAVDTSACPKHHVPWEPGTYGPYCKQLTDDPAWAKHKTDRDGNPVMYCKITPKNAPDWLRVHGAAA